MLVMFPPIFVADTKIIFVCNFVAPLNHFKWMRSGLGIPNSDSQQFISFISKDKMRHEDDFLKIVKYSLLHIYLIQTIQMLRYEALRKNQ